MEVLDLIQYFEDIATKHINIKSFLTGDSWEIAVTGKADYPQLYLLQNFEVSGSDRLETWAVKFRIHDIQLRDESDENQKLDSTFTIAQEVLEYIRQNQPRYFLGDNYDCFSFTESSDDYLAGWAFTIQVSFPTSVNRCTIDGVFLEYCDYEMAALINVDLIKSLTGILINGISQPFNQPYQLNNGFTGVSELNRLLTDLIDAGYAASANYTNAGAKLLTFQLIITNTSDTFTEIQGTGGKAMFNELNCT